MLKKLIISMAGVAVLMVGVSSAQAASSKLGPKPAVAGGHYSSGGGISIAAEVRNFEGRTLVCGVWAQSTSQSILTKFAERRVLGSGSVFLGRDRVVQNLLFMNEVAPAPTYGNLPANCKLTNRAWSDSDAAKKVLIRMPRQVVENQRSGSRYSGGGVQVTFRQTVPDAAFKGFPY